MELYTLQVSRSILEIKSGDEYVLTSAVTEQ